MKKIISLFLVMTMLFTTTTIVFASSTPSAWAENEVDLAKSEDLITSAVTKDYQKDITREEFCELVMKLYQKITGENVVIGSDPFSDTDNNEILKAYSLGIVKGVSDNEFAPNNNITRQEICVMLARCIDMAIDGSDITSFETTHFADRGLIADWAIDSVDYAFSNNIIKGIGENKIDPLGNTTCEQSILLTYRIFDNQDNLAIFDDLTENDLEDLFSVKNTINDSVSDYTNSDGKIDIDSLDTVIDKVADVSRELKENNQILDYNEDETSVWIKLHSGLQFVYVPEIDGFDLSGNNISIMTYQPFNTSYGTERPGSGDMERGIEATDGSARNISNKFNQYRFTQNYDDGQVTLDSLKQIGSNQIILWHGHGGYNSSIHSFLGIGEQLDEVRFLLDPVYYAKNIKYTGDYLSGRIVCLSSGNIGVTSKFFAKYLPQMSNTLVYLGTCESAHDSVLVDTFINKGATTVIGNSSTILTEYNQNMIKSTCDGLMRENFNSQYNTILEAQNYAKSLHGNTDGSENNATPIIYGNQSLRLSHEQDNEMLIYLDELSPISSDRYTGNEGDSFIDTIGKRNGNIDINGNEYNHGLTAWVARWNYTDEISWVWNEYDINGEYEYLQGDIALIKSYNENDFRTKIQIIGDGEVLYEEILTPNNLPIKNLKINITNVDKLKISVKDLESVSGGTAFGLADFRLTSGKYNGDLKETPKYTVPDEIYINELSPINSDRYTGNEGDSFIDTIGKRNGNIDVNGNEYNYGLTAWVARWNYTDEISWVWNEYNLDGAYNSLKGDIVLIKSYNENNFKTQLEIIGDGEVLYSKVLTPDNLPINNIDIDVQGVQTLKISLQDLNGVSGGTAFGLADFRLTN